MTDTVRVTHMRWAMSDYLDMLAKQGFVDSKDIDSVSKVTWSTRRSLDFHHDSVPGEIWSHIVNEDFLNDLSHSEETRGLHRARPRDSAPGEETPELRGATLIDSAVTQGQAGTVPDSGTLGHTTLTKGDFGHTVTRVLQATNIRAGGLQPTDCTKRLGHARDSVDHQWAPSPRTGHRLFRDSLP